MNLEELFKLILSNPKDISIEYYNENGKERLLVNGEELTGDKLEESYDDSEILERARRFKNNIQAIDDDSFNTIIENLSKYVDLSTFNELLDQEHYSEEDSNVLESMISLANTEIHSYLTNKIEALQDILENL